MSNAASSSVRTASAAPVTLNELRGRPSRHRRERLVQALLFLAAGITVLISLAIVASLAGGAVRFLSKVQLGSLLSAGWYPRRGQFDIRTIVVGTFLVGGVAMLVAAPLGLGVAIYLSEYARPGARRILKPLIEILAAIPSVVMGYFALTVINPLLVQRFIATASAFNMAAAGIGVGILVAPLVASVAEDALHAVPLSLREASLGLGARRRRTSLRVVVPAAISGLVAAMILGLSRAIGETMVVAIAAGGTGGSDLTFNIFGPGQTMTAAMSSLATGSDQVQGVGAAFDSLFFVGLLLFAMTFTLNVVSERVVRRVRGVAA